MGERGGRGAEKNKDLGSILKKTLENNKKTTLARALVLLDMLQYRQKTKGGSEERRGVAVGREEVKRGRVGAEKDELQIFEQLN